MSKHETFRNTVEKSRTNVNKHIISYSRTSIKLHIICISIRHETHSKKALSFLKKDLYERMNNDFNILFIFADKKYLLR